ncbi:UDP-N-acetylmuramate dehydrogenase [Butyribacter sp.]|uniref:UDP-N-acetylmuramate dehydrogenase n=1 Tax=Butyribacter sp. TaxID=2822465 RepID=UPI002A96397C|nr:UDP-N-acetylmuramate dehydrogenase [Butyribacter sp.]
MVVSEIVKKLIDINGEKQVAESEPMSRHTTFRIGGPAKVFVSPDNIEKIIKTIELLKNEKCDYFILGNGSNILAADEGYDGVVVSTENLKNLNIEREESNETFIYAEAGVMLSRAAVLASESSLTGLEFAGGIPGTVGGAVSMNAGAYGGEIKDIIVSADVLMSDGTVVKLTRDELELSYRSSIVQKEKMIVLSAEFALKKGNKSEILDKMKDFSQRRRDKQPLEYASAGSTFKRPEGYFAGKLIDDAGLRGYRVGNVMVSDKHCGFVVNMGGGTCEEVKAVINHVREEVDKQFGVTLEMEVRKLGWK